MKYLIVVSLALLCECNNRQKSGYVLANEASWISDSGIPLMVTEAEKGDSHAAYRLGGYYMNIADDREKTLKFYRIAANLGNVKAMYNLGFILISSVSPSEKTEGISWLKAAKNRGDNEAEELLRLSAIE
jgi:TPR repeat protein